MKYPDDADGDALRRVAERSDMSQLMTIDFFVNVPNEPSGEEVARLAAERGYTSVVEFDEDSQQWTCYCTKRLVPTYDAIVAAQQELDNLSAAFGGRSDGWGTLGN
jgi:regulator of RNase E activity RraB